MAEFVFHINEVEMLCQIYNHGVAETIGTEELKQNKTNDIDNYADIFH